MSSLPSTLPLLVGQLCMSSLPSTLPLLVGQLCVFLAVCTSSAHDLPDLPDRGRAVDSCVFYIPVKVMVGQLSAHLV